MFELRMDVYIVTSKSENRKRVFILMYCNQNISYFSSSVSAVRSTFKEIVSSIHLSPIKGKEFELHKNETREKALEVQNKEKFPLFRFFHALVFHHLNKTVHLATEPLLPLTYSLFRFWNE